MRLSISQAAAVAKRGRRLLRAGRISRTDFCVLDCLLWSCRDPASGSIVASFTGLCRLVRCARATLAAALRRLEATGILARVRRSCLVRWAHGGLQRRMLANRYILNPGNCEFTSCTVDRYESTSLEVASAAPAEVSAAQAALRRIAAQRQGALNKQKVSPALI